MGGPTIKTTAGHGSVDAIVHETSRVNTCNEKFGGAENVRCVLVTKALGISLRVREKFRIDGTPGVTHNAIDFGGRGGDGPNGFAVGSNRAALDKKKRGDGAPLNGLVGSLVVLVSIVARVSRLFARLPNAIIVHAQEPRKSRRDSSEAQNQLERVCWQTRNGFFPAFLLWSVLQQPHYQSLRLYVHRHDSGQLFEANVPP